MLVKGGPHGEEDACGAGGQVHRQPKELLTGEGEVIPVRQGVPTEAAHVGLDQRVRSGRACGHLAAEVQDHPGPAVEEPGLDVNRKSVV